MTNKFYFVIVLSMFLLLITPNAFAARARVTDASGQTYDVAKAKLLRGKTMTVLCGNTSIEVPFKRIRSMRIDPSQITPVNGNAYFGVEILMGGEESVTIGNISEYGRCLIGSGNGLRGRVARTQYRVPFSDIRFVEIIGKEEAETAGDGDEDDDEE